MNTCLVLVLLLASALSEHVAPCPGCPYEADTNSGEIRDLLSTSLNQANGNLKLVNIKKCTKQVVAGTKYSCEIEVSGPENAVKTCQLEILHQPWISQQPSILSETCSTTRSKREICAGCPVEQDVNDETIKGMMAGALAQTNSGLSMVKATHCTSQVVAGVKYKCTVEVTSPTLNGVQTCTIEVLSQPWISKAPQVLSEDCTKLTQRAKREVCAGCPVEHDVNDEKIKGMMSTALSQTNSGLTMVKPTHCTSQVVSGVKYKCTVEVTSPTLNGVQTCTIEVLSQPWISKAPQVLSEDCTKLTQRAKRSVGGFKPVVGKSDHINTIAQEVAHRVSLMVNSPYVKRVLNILKAEEQVVSGINYALTLELSDTDCLKSTMTPNAVCNFPNEPNEVLVCSANVYDAPFKNERKISNINCHNIPPPSVSVVKRSVGGEQELAVDSQVVLDLLDFVASEVTARSNANSRLKVVKTLSAKQQIVSGRIVTLKVLLASTDCPSETQSSVDCAAKEVQKVCEISIWEQPWLNSRKVTKFSLENVQ